MVGTGSWCRLERQPDHGPSRCLGVARFDLRRPKLHSGSCLHALRSRLACRVMCWLGASLRVGDWTPQIEHGREIPRKPRKRDRERERGKVRCTGQGKGKKECWLDSASRSALTCLFLLAVRPCSATFFPSFLGLGLQSANGNPCACLIRRSEQARLKPTPLSMLFRRWSGGTSLTLTSLAVLPST